VVWPKGVGDLWLGTLQTPRTVDCITGSTVVLSPDNLGLWIEVLTFY